MAPLERISDYIVFKCTGGDACETPASKIEEAVENNIKCALGKAGLWLDSYTGVTLLDELLKICIDEDGKRTCYVNHEFEVHDYTGLLTLARGIAVTEYYMCNSGGFASIAWTVITMPKSDAKRIHCYTNASKS